MARPPRAREGALDAYETLLINEGERAATLDAIAQLAGVSKGGLLYHFASKDALVEGLLDRLTHRVTGDIAAMNSAEEGVVDYYLRTSTSLDDPLDRTLIATSRLAQAGDAAATAMMHTVRNRWADAIRPHVRDAAALDLVMLVSDGLYFNNSLDGQAANHASREDSPTPASGDFVPQGAALDALMALVHSVVTP